MESNNTVHACACCQKEHGIQAEPGTSHGYCQRHLVGMYRQLAAATLSDAYETKIAQILTSPATNFPPDLGEMKQAA